MLSSDRIGKGVRQPGDAALEGIKTSSILYNANNSAHRIRNPFDIQHIACINRRCECLYRTARLVVGIRVIELLRLALRLSSRPHATADFKRKCRNGLRRPQVCVA